ncbi:MAG: hypothetical protein RBS89_00900 [Candidatus Delongbacteria bacterium]|jgi:O-antigen/teichoic acid export membrane protein|nr:hypothetical protein [Candidatus Delongbacteria bacterium]
MFSKKKENPAMDFNDFIEAEKAIVTYKNKYSEIKENIVMKISKNLVFSVLKVLFYLLSLLFLITLIKAAFTSEETLNEIEYWSKKEILWSYFAMFTFSFVIARIIRSNIQKRNSIHSLIKLLDEIFGYMDEELAQEGKRIKKAK